MPREDGLTTADYFGHAAVGERVALAHGQQDIAAFENPAISRRQGRAPGDLAIAGNDPGLRARRQERMRDLLVGGACGHGDTRSAAARGWSGRT